MYQSQTLFQSSKYKGHQEVIGPHKQPAKPFEHCSNDQKDLARESGGIRFNEYESADNTKMSGDNIFHINLNIKKPEPEFREDKSSVQSPEHSSVGYQSFQFQNHEAKTTYNKGIDFETKFKELHSKPTPNENSSNWSWFSSAPEEEGQLITGFHPCMHFIFSN